MFRILLFITLSLLPPFAYATVCDTNQYINNDQCYTCPANATCNDGINFTCNNGWYKQDTTCIKCDINNATCTGPNDYSCMPDFYDNGTTCIACPNNATCAGGHEFYTCNDGYYKADRNTSCRSCDGQVCDGDTLVHCGDGYILYQSRYCMFCGANSYCPAGAPAKRCQTGYYYNPNNSGCLACPTGYYCPLGESTTSNMYQYCDTGYYRTGNMCAPCDTDTVCPGGKIDEMVCPDGLYKHDNGQCLTYAPDDCGLAPNCNPGCYNSSNTCTKCPIDDATCTSTDKYQCMAGYYDNGILCELCPTNSNCPMGSSEITCLPGYYLDKQKCHECGNGYYCIDNIRTKCPPAVLGENIDTPPNDINFVSGRTLTNPSAIASTINACYLYFPTFSNIAGTFMLNVSGQFDGTKYPINYSQTKMWRAANTGYYLDTEIQNSEGTFYKYAYECTNGPDNSYYTSTGTIGGNNCPWICIDGYYRDGNKCVVCPNDMNCIGGTIVCPVGTYRSGNTCLICPTGYTDAPTSGAQSINECKIKCNGGTYIATSTTATCQNVGVGYWINENYTNYGDIGIRNECNGGMTTIGYGPGADEDTDCGRKLHFGNHVIHLRSNKKTTPSLVVQYGQNLLYANTSSETVGHLRMKINETIYSIYDDSMYIPYDGLD